MSDFLRASNTRAGVFRDVIAEGYDPLQPRNHSIKIPTGLLVNFKAQINGLMAAHCYLCGVGESACCRLRGRAPLFKNSRSIEVDRGDEVEGKE
jgi:hypothetical protein